MELYSDHHPNTSRKGLGFKNKEKAIHTLNEIKDTPLTYQKQVVITMYNRAKYHPHQTKEMREAMIVFRKWMIKHKIKIET